jgi:DNA anti-recombination protein RmuC
MATMTEITLDKRVDDLREETRQGFAQVDQHFAQIDRRFEEQNHQIDLRFAQVDRRFEEQNHQVDQRFDRVESDIRELRTEMKDGFAALDSKFDAKFDSLNRTIVWLLGGSLSVVSAGILAAVFHALF